MTLKELQKGRIARVVLVAGGDADLEAKLREIGFSEGDEVELLHRGLFGGNPIAVRLNRTIVALRGDEAAAVEIADDATSDREILVAAE